jgi:hypothetical protein
MKPIRDMQGKSLQCHADEVKRYETDLAFYEKALTAWKRDSKAGGDPPEKPAEPQAVRYVVSDTTVEALSPLLLANPRGLLLARDELAGWLGSFDKYAKGKVSVAGKLGASFAGSGGQGARGRIAAKWGPDGRLPQQGVEERDGGD